MPKTTSYLNVVREAAGITLEPSGIWTLSNFNAFRQALTELSTDTSGTQPNGSFVIDGSRLDALDTSGALALLEASYAIAGQTNLTFRNFKDIHQEILTLVSKQSDGKGYPPIRPLSIIAYLGKETLHVLQNLRDSLSFLGQFFCEILPLLRSPQQLRGKELTVQLELAVVKSLPVIVLVNFLIGTVVAYIFADQVRRYGANIFAVDGVAVAMGRELSPLIVAIVMAGRSGSAFTAQLGAMKINQELDAIQAMGLSIGRLLVIPRVLALVIALPLLGMLGAAVGLSGGVLIAQMELGITPLTFLERLQNNVPVRHFVIGLCKAPVFALFIGLIGCRMGLAVENNTRSVGLNTTSTVVQSIVAVILLDALFAVVLMKLGL